MHAPYQIVSLLNMLELGAERFARMMSRIATFKGVMSGLLSIEESPPPNFPGDPLFSRGLFSEMKEDIEALGLDAALVSLERLESVVQPPMLDAHKVLKHLADLESRIVDQLRAKTFLFLSPLESARYTHSTPLMGEEVQRQFPSLAYDIAEGGKCLALGRSTAAAFHFIRCLEGGILALAECLGLPKPTTGAERNWGVRLRSIKNEIDAKWPASARFSGDGRFFEEAYGTLAAIQNPYRNATMHLDTNTNPRLKERIALLAV